MGKPFRISLVGGLKVHTLVSDLSPQVFSLGREERGGVDAVPITERGHVLLFLRAERFSTTRFFSLGSCLPGH